MTAMLTVHEPLLHRIECSVSCKGLKWMTFIRKKNICFFPHNRLLNSLPSLFVTSSMHNPKILLTCRWSGTIRYKRITPRNLRSGYGKVTRVTAPHPSLPSVQSLCDLPPPSAEVSDRETRRRLVPGVEVDAGLSESGVSECLTAV